MSKVIVPPHAALALRLMKAMEPVCKDQGSANQLLAITLVLAQAIVHACDDLREMDGLAETMAQRLIHMSHTLWNEKATPAQDERVH